MNDIQLRQNEAGQLERLGAMRQVYSFARLIWSLQVFLGVFCVVALTIVSRLTPALERYSVAWACSIALLDILLFTPVIRSLVTLAAGIQELFDCYVLDIPFNALRVRSKPTREAVIHWSWLYQRCHSNPEFTDLTDWYPANLGEIQHDIARLVCQRTNLSWDCQQRRKYAHGIAWVAGVSAGIIAIVSINWNIGAADLTIRLFAPLLPVVLLASRQRQDNIDGSQASDGLIEDIERLIDQAVSGSISPEQLAFQSRQLQDQIYDKRRNSSVVPQFVYRRCRVRQEWLMNKTAEQIVQDVKRRLKKL